MLTLNSDDIVLELDSAPVDPRTGNKVLYHASWQATTPSMIGSRNEDWVTREIDWFLSGTNALAGMEPPVPRAFQECAGYDGKVNSAYGHILFGYGEELPPGAPLYDRMVFSFLREGAATRHSVAIISDRDIHSLYRKNGRKDFICTNALTAMITPEWRLHLTAQMRSMDAVWGYRADYSMWDTVMNMLIKDLTPTYPQVTRGDIYFQVANLHVYPRHFTLLSEEANRIQDDLTRRMMRVWHPTPPQKPTPQKTPAHEPTTQETPPPAQKPLF